MADMIKMGKTGDFKSCIRAIQHKTRFAGVDDNGDPIYNNDPLPKLTFTGTTKLHGTNASISWQDGQLFCQSRNNIVEGGHFGFPEMIQQETYAVMKMVDNLRLNSVMKTGEKITVYGEWAGPGIQQGVGISLIPKKTWFIFGVKITDVNGDGRWMEDYHAFTECDSERIRDITEFGDYQLEIDFENPLMIQNQLVELTNAVEDNCPVASHILADDEAFADDCKFLGEGIVWTTYYKGDRFNFKVKGEKHSVTKVKKLKVVDQDKLGRVQDFVEYCVTENRIKQAMFEISPKNQEIGLTKADTGAIIQWVKKDILEEEAFEMKERELEWADVAGTANTVARKHFFTELDKTL